MTDRKKVIRGLEQFKADFKPFCGNKSDWARVDDALALLKAHEPRVMTPEEVMQTGPEDVCGIVEIIEEEHMYGCWMRRYDEEHVELLCDVPNLPEKLQKGCARIWTARPTEEQRKAVKWDAETST
jgi:hypothetical protein